MSYVTMQSLLKRASEKGVAIGSFNVFNLDSLQGVMNAAEAKNSPVIIAYAESHIKYGDLEVMAYAIQNLAEKSKVEVAAQFDHGKTIAMVKKAIGLGFSSVMYDGYDIPYEQKVEETREIVEAAHEKGLSVEAPLGRIGTVGEEDKKRYEHDKLTKPELVADFVNRTGIDNLAVAIGTMHGRKDGSTTLNFDLLKAIKNETKAYISLHGGSGVKDDDYRKAIELGISKISIFTRVANAGTFAIKKALETSTPRFPDLMVPAKAGVSAEVQYLMDIFRSSELSK
jgi:fructose-bisphosphate aldolase class II